MKSKFIAVLVGCFVYTSAAVAEPLVIFPAKDQTKEQQKKDEVACYLFAVDETGFDPAEAKVEVDDPERKRGGAVRGAAAGVIIGDDSESTAIGAGVGAARQARQNRKAQEAAAEERKKQEAEIAAKKEHFRKAQSVCLEAKGYLVK